jgi:Rab GDP dissociation inhibitor
VCVLFFHLTLDNSFYSVRDVYEPLADGTSDNTFITISYDATSHFETSTTDIMDMYRRITGEELDLTPPPAAAE